MPREVAVVLTLCVVTNMFPTTTKMSVSWWFSETFGVTSYGKGCRKDAWSLSWLQSNIFNQRCAREVDEAPLCAWSQTSNGPLALPALGGHEPELQNKIPHDSGGHELVWPSGKALGW